LEVTPIFSLAFMAFTQLTIDHFLEYFRQAEKPRAQWKLGLEQELIGYDADLKHRLTYEGHIRGVLEAFALRFGWKGYQEGAHLIGLKQYGSSITLEPGGQLELSCAPMQTIGEIDAFLKQYQIQLSEISQGRGIKWLSIGYDPISHPDQVGWVPKKRYQVMGEYLPPLGAGAHHMMKTTATAQSNLDYSSEADMIQKMRASTAFAPFVGILFGTSPFAKGQPAGCKSRRGWAWRNMSPQHTGFLDLIFEPDFGYRQYIEYILDVPMLVLERNGEIVDMRGVNFREFIKKGYQGLSPELADWPVQLGATFPVARLRNAIETRTCDAGPYAMLLGQAALWKGLLYCQTCLDWANEVIAQRGGGFFKELYEQSYCYGFTYLKEHKEYDRLMQEFLEQAQKGLERLGQGEEAYLALVKAIFESRFSLADQLLKGYAQGVSMDQLFEETDLYFARG